MKVLNISPDGSSVLSYTSQTIHIIANKPSLPYFKTDISEPVLAAVWSRNSALIIILTTAGKVALIAKYCSFLFDFAQPDGSTVQWIPVVNLPL